MPKPIYLKCSPAHAIFETSGLARFFEQRVAPPNDNSNNNNKIRELGYMG